MKYTRKKNNKNGSFHSKTFLAFKKTENDDAFGVRTLVVETMVNDHYANALDLTTTKDSSQEAPRKF